MVNPDEFKSKIEGMVSQDYKIEFLGDNFKKVAEQISEMYAEKIYSWITEVIQKKIPPLYIGSEKKYKNWKIRELLTFRHAFTIGNSEYRILFVKVKNSIFIEFHLGDHKYYDKIRKGLGMKQGNL
jgi:hypothetical protein